MTNSDRLVYIWLFYTIYCSSWLQCADRWYTCTSLLVSISLLCRISQGILIDGLNICCLTSHREYFHRLYTKHNRLVVDPHVKGLLKSCDSKVYPIRFVILHWIINLSSVAVTPSISEKRMLITCVLTSLHLKMTLLIWNILYSF